MEITFSSSRDFFGVTVFLVNEGLELSKALKDLDKASFITKAISLDKGFTGKFGQICLIPLPTEDRLFLIVGIGKKYTENGMRSVGECVASKLNSHKIASANIYVDEIASQELGSDLCASSIAFGVKLRNYAFTKYYTTKIEEHSISLNTINMVVDSPEKTSALFTRFGIVADATNMVRDLINEPANVLSPVSFAEKCLSSQEFGIKVTVLTGAEMKTLGMNALLGVAQGSINEPRMVILEWNGDPTDTSKIALVGKGVTFDTGGINLKPSTGIAEMKHDMAGAAVVFGVITALAKRKAKVNALSVLGLVENMPSGSAQRPSDVVVSLSKQTIEVDNTDAEGRLVLADALWYTIEKYSPQYVIDIATLTGAIVIALGDGYAGLFSNDDTLAGRLIEAGKKTGNLLWRMPMGDHYDKQINSDIADVKNTGQAGRGGGSITAAQFLQRFVKDSKWAHIDIAAVDHAKFLSHSPKGATGFGVRLLEEFIYANHEKR